MDIGCTGWIGNNLSWLYSYVESYAGVDEDADIEMKDIEYDRDVDMVPVEDIMIDDEEKEHGTCCS